MTSLSTPRPAAVAATDDVRASVPVVICAYTERRWDDLTRVVAAVAGQTCAPSQTLLVIDHNPALLARATAAFPEVTVLPSSGVPGLSGARNTGVAASLSDLVAFVDDDAVPAADWLARLVAAFTTPDVLGVGGAAAPDWPRTRPRWWPEEFDWVVGCSYRGLPERRAPIRNLMGCSMAFRRGVFDGLEFREGLGRVQDTPDGCEETELCIRVRQRHPEASFVYEPTSLVRHRVTDERATVGYFLRRCHAEGRSKARMVEVVGAGDGLASERAYALRTLVRGVARALGDAAAGDAAAPARGGMIILGFATTVLGYLQGHMGAGAASAPAQPADHDATFAPIRVADLELTAPVPDPGDLRHDGTRSYSAARLLVRFAGAPVGQVDVDLDGDAVALAGRVWVRLGAEVNARLAAVGRDPVAALPLDGLAPPPRDEVDVLPQVAVVIATHDRAAPLSRCLYSLRRSDHRPSQIIVVDNAPSSDETRTMLRREHPDVVYVLEPQPGLGLAHDRALPHVTAPIVAITDDDVIVDSGWTGQIARRFAADPSVGCVTGLIATRELETEAQWWIEHHGAFDKGVASRRYHLDRPPADQPLFPWTAGTLGSGANMAFDTALLRRIGGFDAGLGAGSPGVGGDDLAAFVDVLLAGRALHYEPSAIVRHAAGRDADDLLRQVRNYGTGLGAYATRLVVRHPRAAIAVLGRLPAVVAHVRRRRLAAAGPQTFDRRALLVRELRGVLAGPAAYLRGRRAAPDLDLRPTQGA